MANWTCTICLEDLQQEPTCSPSTCGHVLHSKCMKDWVKKNPRCPVCNARVSTRGMRELYFSEDVGDSLKTEKEALERKCQELSEQIKNQEAENNAVRKELASSQEKLIKSRDNFGKLIRKKVNLRTELEKQQDIVKVLQKRVECREAQASTQAAMAIKIRRRFRQSAKKCCELRNKLRLQKQRLSKNAKQYLSGTAAMRKELFQCKRKIVAFEKEQNAPKIMDVNRERKFRDALQKIQKVLAPSTENNKAMEKLSMENLYTETAEQLKASKVLVTDLRSELRETLKEKEEFSKLNSNLAAELQQKVGELENERATIAHLQAKLRTSMEVRQPSPMETFSTVAIDQLRESEALVAELRSKQWESFKENEELSTQNSNLTADLQEKVRELERERSTIARLQTELRELSWENESKAKDLADLTEKLDETAEREITAEKEKERLLMLTILKEDEIQKKDVLLAELRAKLEEEAERSDPVREQLRQEIIAFLKCIEEKIDIISDSPADAVDVEQKPGVSANTEEEEGEIFEEPETKVNVQVTELQVLPDDRCNSLPVSPSKRLRADSLVKNVISTEEDDNESPPEKIRKIGQNDENWRRNENETGIKLFTKRIVDMISRYVQSDQELSSLHSMLI